MARSRRVIVTAVPGRGWRRPAVPADQQVGLPAIGEGLKAVGPGFAGILLVSYLRFVARAAAWMALLGEPVPARAARSPR